MLRMGAPMVAAGTVWLAAKALRAGYAQATGNPPPRPDDIEAPIVTVVIYAVAMASVSALINVGIQREVAKAIHKSEAPVPV